MIKNKLFCKLIGIVCSVFITCLSGMNNNFVGAVNSRVVLDSVLEKHPELKQSLGFKSHKGLCDKIRSVYERGTFSRSGRGYRDNVHFVCFIKFIADIDNAELDEKIKQSLIHMVLKMRSEEELKRDRDIVKCYPEIMGEFMREIFGMPPLEIKED